MEQNLLSSSDEASVHFVFPELPEALRRLRLQGSALDHLPYREQCFFFESDVVCSYDGPDMSQVIRVLL
jgi:hypothetical protein